MILVIRISGMVEVPSDVQEALFRLNLRKKYTATLLSLNENNLKLLRKIRDFVAYGIITKETLTLLIQKRGQPIDKKKKINIEEIIAQIDKSSLSDVALKPFFRLHPPRGGIDSKLHFPIRKGVLGDNKEKINDLVRRML